jgi:hypothetical protein
VPAFWEGPSAGKSNYLHPTLLTLDRYREVGSAAAPVRYTEAVMDANPLPVEIGRRMLEVGQEAVLIGNSAAAPQGAPVATNERALLDLIRRWQALPPSRVCGLTA